MTASKVEWLDLGPADELKKKLESSPLTEIVQLGVRLAVSYRNGTFGAISGICNHLAGPLGKGTLDGDYVVCPWHYWKFHRTTGDGEPGYEADHVPHHTVKIENHHVLVSREAVSKRTRLPHPPHALARAVEREPGPVRIAGISTTVMDNAHPRVSTSEMLLEYGLNCAQGSLKAETKLIKLRQLNFRHCEGFYSKHARACSWPCSITQMDEKDQLDQVYEALVHWADVLIIATPIRWGSASSLYYKMAERLNCVQNYITTHNKVLIKNKVVAFVITGGQDNIQSVAGQMLGFFSELGFVLPPFPYVAHSLGWSAENMERNVRVVEQSDALREGTRDLIRRAIQTYQALAATAATDSPIQMGGRKGHDSAKPDQ